jgi:hypothetical protein
MIKATIKLANGKQALMIGLSRANLEFLQAHPVDSYLRIKGDEIGIPIDVALFAGETEEAILEHFKELIGPDTKLHIDPKLKGGTKNDKAE